MLSLYRLRLSHHQYCGGAQHIDILIYEAEHRNDGNAEAEDGSYRQAPMPLPAQPSHA